MQLYSVYTSYRRNRCIIFFHTKNVCAIDMHGLQPNKLYVEYQLKLPSFHTRRRVINDDGFWILGPNDKRRFYAVTEAAIVAS